MTDKHNEKIKFLKTNRQSLRETKDIPPLIVLAANSLMQASSDRAFPFIQDSNFFYLTGIEEPGIILVIDEKEEFLIAPDRSRIREVFEGTLDHTDLSMTSGIKMVYAQEEGWKRLKKRLGSEKQVGILEPPESYIASADMFTNPSRRYLKEQLHEKNSKLEFVDLRKKLTAMRMIKSPYELKMIKRAVDETIKLLDELERKRDIAKNEADLMAAATDYVMRHQLRYSFDPIIAGGKNAVTLHYVNNNDPLRPGELLLLDVGLKWGGYSADLTRTVSFNPTIRQNDVYRAVIAVQDYALSLLKPGLRLREYEEEVLKIMGRELRKLGIIDSLDKEIIKQYYPHGTSHFLGIDTHDAGDYELPLKAGMVLTVEPGIYIRDEGIGIRIEDNILITEDGNKVLSSMLPRNVASLTITS